VLYTAGQYEIGGGDALPTIFFYGPDLDKDKRRELISRFTAAASELTGINERAFVVYLQATRRDEVGVGGKLLEDRYNESEE